MKAAILLCGPVALSLIATVEAQDLYPDFALVVQLPSYEAFLTNLGQTMIRVDGYLISSPSGTLNPSGWRPLNAAGSEAVAALGPGANQFFVANPSANSIAELNPIGSATWKPGQSWSIGFPFKTDDSGLAQSVTFEFSSPDGLVLKGGTVVSPSNLYPAAIIVVSEPSTDMLCLLGPAALLAVRSRALRTLSHPCSKHPVRPL